MGRSRRPRAFAVAVVTGLLLGVPGGCAEFRVQTSPGAPHGLLAIHIAHDRPREGFHEDLATVDGKSMRVGSGRGGKLMLRLSPGVHTVKLSSAPIHYELKSALREQARFTRCPYPGCGAFSPAQHTEVDVVPVLGPACECTADVRIELGTRFDLPLLVDSKGRCWQPQ